MERGYYDRSRSPRNRANDGYYGRDEYRQRPYDSYDARGSSHRTRSRSPVGIDRYQPARDQQRESSRSGPPHPQAREAPSRNDRIDRNVRNDRDDRDDRNDGRGRRPHMGNNPTIDRYVPGQDDTVTREREAPIFNPLPKPEQSAYLLQYFDFRDWWTREQEVIEDRDRRSSGGRRSTISGEKDSREAKEKQREKLQAAYDEYKEGFIGKSTKSFVLQHKGEEWFKERYNTDVRVPFRERLAVYRLGNYERWSNDLTSGVFDDFNLEGIYKSDSNGAGGVLEKEEGEATGAAEVQAVSDLVPAKGADLRDEATKQPALLIKTMAAHVQRSKIEDFCKEHLGEGPGGYRWLSLGEPNAAKKFTRLGWVLLRPKEDEESALNGHVRGEGRDGDDGGDDKEEDKIMLDAEQKGSDNAKGYVDQAHAKIDNKVIEDEEKGNFTCHFGVHDPQTAPRKKALWDLMSFPDRIDRDLEWATRLTLKLEQELGSEADGVSLIHDHVEKLRGDGRLQPVTSQPINKNETAVLGDEGESGVEEGEEQGEDMGEEEEVDDEELLAKKKKLDLLVEYLRRVYNFCLFCVIEADSVIDLERKCAGGHLRRPRASLTTLAKKCARATVYGEPFPLKKGKAQGDEDGDEGANNTDHNPTFDKKNSIHTQLQKAFSWITRYEDMLRQIMEPETVHLKKLGARPMEEALDEDLKSFRIADAEGERIRCKITEDCKKMFKTEQFWRKHVEKRHTEWLEGVKKELKEIEAFALDPNHVQAYTVGPNGSSRNGMLPGLSRNAGMSGFPGSFGNATFGSGTGFPPMQMQAAFGQVLPNMAMGGVGPARRGGRQNHRTAGPYDRQPSDARAMRYRAGGSSDMVPPRSARAQHFPDAMSGSGSREAVQGRKMTDYQDLDAPQGASKPHMDY